MYQPDQNFQLNSQRMKTGEQPGSPIT